MAIDIVQSNSRIIRKSCPNSAYKQEHRREVAVLEMKTFLDRFIKGWPVEQREVEVGVEEIKVNTMGGEIQVWEVIVRKCSWFGCVYPLEENISGARDRPRAKCTELMPRNSELIFFSAGFDKSLTLPASHMYSLFNLNAVRRSIASLDIPKN